MTKKIILLILVAFAFFSCSNDENEIKQVVNTCQNALNSNDYEAFANEFETPSSYELKTAFEMLDVYKKHNIETVYTIDVLEVTVNGNIAEAKLKTSVKFLGNDKDTVRALTAITPAVTDSIMTFRKMNNNWKIIAEKIIE